MGLRDDLQADIAEAFDGEDDLADAVSSFTGSRTTISDVYDPVTGTYPETTIGYSGRGVFGGFTATEMTGRNLLSTGAGQAQHILATDVKMIALQNEVLLDSDSSEAVPTVGDNITYNGNTFRVVNTGQDPAGASWTVQLRKA